MREEESEATRLEAEGKANRLINASKPNKLRTAVREGGLQNWWEGGWLANLSMQSYDDILFVGHSSAPFTQIGRSRPKTKPPSLPDLY